MADDRLLRETADAVLALDEPWPALVEAGLAGVGVPEEAGGSGGDLADAAVLLRAQGYHGAAVPLAETLLAGRLLAAAALPVPPGPLTVVPGRSARRVPWARRAHRLVVLDGDRVAVVAPDDVETVPGTNVAGEPRDDVTVRGELAAVPCPVTAGDVALRGALLRSVQLTGAMRRALELTVRHAGEREQFGRPVGRFQAVRQQLAELAGEAAVADVAVRAALRTPGDVFAVAAAKLNASRAAGAVADLAHQVHGAIGVTSEHPLGALTTRLWAWRDEFGGEAHWARRLGELGRVPWEEVTRTGGPPPEGATVW
ncbi:acyl-CoA dehydrogenase [Actinomadura logoneensis]|uniref:Acyl-CoA dehydrogenase n=1 Tax=Actinomadura logoneensis TaxID=2293572 RepID=A0A372J9S2_9ACTN|nr:acyl-CoA dehydrogenase family protein [Actinomadura logoneensis]RFU36742.1 acyl-CoA dehydrogenase [Actinomadura logoneensis]